MQVKIITFSQTGNTRKMAKSMAAAMRGLNRMNRNLRQRESEWKSIEIR